MQCLACGRICQMVAARRCLFPYCFLWVPLLDTSFSGTIAQNYSLAFYCLQINFSLLRFRFQGSAWWILRVFYLYFSEFISVLFLIVLWVTHVLFYLRIFAHDSILSRNVFLLPLTLFRHFQSAPQIQVSHHFPEHSSTRPFLWVLLVLVCAHHLCWYLLTYC